MKNTALLFLLLCLGFVSTQAQNMIDAAFIISDEEAEIAGFIKDDEIIFYSIDADESIPAMPLKDVFENFPFDHVDAAFNDDNKKLFFFSGSQHVRIDLETGIIDEGYPKSTSSEFSGIDFKTIDAVVQWENGKTYFFSQGKYSRYDNENQKTDKNYPQTINDRTWPGLDYNDIDAAFTLSNEITCFFKDVEYVVFNNKEDRADEDFPNDISDFSGLVEALNGELPDPYTEPDPEPTPEPSGDGMEFFHGTWAEVLAESKATGKLIFVDAYATWCGPCKWMAKSVFPDGNVGSIYNNNFINYKFDMEKGEGPAFARKYGVNAYPSLFFIDGSGKTVQKEVGALDVDELVSVGKKVAKKHGGLNKSKSVNKNAIHGSGGNEQ